MFASEVTHGRRPAIQSAFAERGIGATTAVSIRGVSGGGGREAIFERRWLREPLRDRLGGGGVPGPARDLLTN